MDDALQIYCPPPPKPWSVAVLIAQIIVISKHEELEQGKLSGLAVWSNHSENL